MIFSRPTILSSFIISEPLSLAPTVGIVHVTSSAASTSHPYVQTFPTTNSQEEPALWLMIDKNGHIVSWWYSELE
ncbi:hypothetical protein XELAEV_18011305mg [Xenopus laevis]|uniref:Uncharacterized protein n=1 Tax=Xenopus laevis TaxID=8355 RepID=A0A974DM15_XENLA|nr:hypothetical protein XELAEV_18011305mg [Xenopus laevis]